eukprot:GSMAST32.ASY1.ANO1.2550.1 assembled CDS
MIYRRSFVFASKFVRNTRFYSSISVQPKKHAALSATETKLFNKLVVDSQTYPIPIRGDDCDILLTPSSFFDALIEGVKSAKTRITLASLYIGTGEQEQRLLSTISEACKRNPSLQVNFFLDASRASRSGHGESSNSLSLLSKLVEAHPKSIAVGLFVAPQLWGILGKILPSRFKEVAVPYVFDDDLIMSGANLSADYFTNRQDR